MPPIFEGFVSMIKNCNIIFCKLGGWGRQRPFGIFPKNYQFWYPDPSLRTLTTVSFPCIFACFLYPYVFNDIDKGRRTVFSELVWFKILHFYPLGYAVLSNSVQLHQFWNRSFNLISVLELVVEHLHWDMSTLYSKEVRKKESMRSEVMNAALGLVCE